MHNTALFILILVISVAFVLSPMLKMLPSAREKEQMKLRRKAMSLGMQVKLCVVPYLKKTIEKIYRPDGIAYRLMRERDQMKKFQHKKTRQWVRKTGDNDWYQLQDRGHTHIDCCEITELLTPLTPACTAYESAADSCAIFWQEKGTEQDVENIYQTIQNIQKLESRFLLRNTSDS